MMNDIVLDPGHGGWQRRGNSSPEGARFGSGMLEKELNYGLAQRIARSLGGARLTRGPDENCSLAERIQAARDGNARAFVSLHTSAPGGQAGIWVHPQAGAESMGLAESIRRQLAPAYAGAVQVARGELAVLSPSHHHRGTAACLVDLGVGDPSVLEAAAAAIARGVRGHMGAQQYGRRQGRIDRGLDLIEPPTPLPGDPAQAVRTIADWLSQRLHFITPVSDTSSFPFSAICRLEWPDGSWGTGFYVSSNRILTAGHVLYDPGRGGPVASIDVVPGKNGPGVEPFGRFTVTSADLFVHPSFAGGGSDFDLGVLRVNRPPPAGRYFDHLDTTPHSVGGVAICGYASGLGADHRQHLDTDFIREVSANMERGDYGANTMPGTSGSPVFYTVGVEDPVAQQSRIDVGVQGVHTDSSSTGTMPAGQVNACVLLTDAKVNWIWSL